MVAAAAMIDSTLSGAKKATGDSVPAVTLTKPSIAAWLPCISPMSYCTSGGGGSSVASWVVYSKIGMARASRSLLIPLHGVLVAPGAGERLVDRGRVRLGAAKRVSDALCGNRVLGVRGIADERPPGAVRLSDEVGDTAP